MKHDEKLSGFAVIELLVVSLIIGTMLALLVPAVQNARASARRVVCQHNLKQVGIALQNHQSHFRTLPVGARQNNVHGISWWVAVAPYLEQGSILDGFDVTGRDNGYVLMHSRNGRVVNGLKIVIMLCPASPLEPLLPVGSYWVMMPSYVGIAGAANGNDFRELRTESCCVPRIDGEISAGGVLFPNDSVRLDQIADGTSNTIIVGEASDASIAASGLSYRIDGGHRPGWIMGTSVRGTPPDYEFPNPAWNITTIRYAPNTRKYELPGIDHDHGPNNPLISAHAGGVNMLFVDGSASFVADDVEINVLKKLATRDDSRIKF